MEFVFIQLMSKQAEQPGERSSRRCRIVQPEGELEVSPAAGHAAEGKRGQLRIDALNAAVRRVRGRDAGGMEAVLSEDIRHVPQVIALQNQPPEQVGVL